MKIEDGSNCRVGGRNRSGRERLRAGCRRGHPAVSSVSELSLLLISRPSSSRTMRINTFLTDLRCHNWTFMSSGLLFEIYSI